MNNTVFPKGEFVLLNNKNNNYILFHAPTLQIYDIKNYILVDYIKRALNNEFSIDKLSSEELTSLNNFINQIIEKSKKSAPSLLVKIGETINPIFRSVILPISGDCNLACPYCFARINDKFNFGNYSKDETKKVIDFLYNKSNKEFNTHIAFFGGEPFLNFPIIEYAIEYIKETYPDFNVSFSATTNGTIINNKIIKFLKANHFQLMISLDGPKSDENLRRYLNGRHSIENVLKNIDKFKENNIPIQLRGTITNECNSIVSIYDFFEKLKIPFHIVFAYKSGNKKHSYSNYDQSNLENVKLQLNELNSYYLDKISKTQKIYCESIFSKINKLRFRREHTINCTGGRNMFSITNDGSIFSCEHLANDKRYSIGDIQEGIDMNKLDGFISKNLNTIERCTNCHVRYLCSGGCFSEKILCNRGITDHLEDDSCSLIKLEWEQIILLYSEIKKKHPSFLETL